MTKITLIKGDITTQKVDAIVNAANSSLRGGGGVDGAIHDVAGDELYEECATLGGCNVGEAKITKGYNLPAKHVIHTVGPIYGSEDGKEAELLKSCYITSLKLANEHKLRSIAFPAISTGVYGYPLDEATEIAIDTIKNYIHDNPDHFDEIIFVAYNDEADTAYNNKIESDSKLMSKNPNLFPKATAKRGVFLLAAEFPSGGYTFISVPKKESLGLEEGYYLLMFNELMLADSYVHKFREQLETKKTSADFPTDFIFIKEILDQEEWDKVIAYMLSDNIRNALINPCLEEKTKYHNCVVRPISFEKHPDFNELNQVFESIINEHVNMKSDNEDEIINLTVWDNYNV